MPTSSANLALCHQKMPFGNVACPYLHPALLVSRRCLVSITGNRRNPSHSSHLAVCACRTIAALTPFFASLFLLWAKTFHQNPLSDNPPLLMQNWAAADWISMFGDWESELYLHCNFCVLLCCPLKNIVFSLFFIVWMSEDCLRQQGGMLLQSVEDYLLCQWITA